MSRIATGFLIIAMIGAGIGCMRTPGIEISGGEPPSFVVDGQAPVYRFVVSDATTHSGKWTIDWEVQTKHGQRRFNIMYGTVPSGFQQTSPEGGKPAPSLRPGILYSYLAEGFIKGNRGCFRMTEGRAVQVDCATGK
ncbi:MAG TPA: hypothetical protein VI756_20025 [Blastocatellia bacterium]